MVYLYSGIIVKYILIYIYIYEIYVHTLNMNLDLSVFEVTLDLLLVFLPVTFLDGVFVAAEGLLVDFL